MANRIHFKQILGLFTNRQNNTTNNADPSNTRMEYGWGAIQFGGAGASTNEAVTFRQAFTAVPVVIISFGGDHTNTAIALGNGGNTVHMAGVAKAVAITVNGFQAYVYHGAAQNWSTNDIVYYHWIAIGA